jgi:ABC-2 type transport system permease protein
VFLMTAPVVGTLSIMPSRVVNELAFLASPSTLVSGVGTWALGDLLEPESQGGGLPIGGFGPVYALAAVVLVSTCVALLLLRYRKVAAR